MKLLLANQLSIGSVTLLSSLISDTVTVTLGNLWPIKCKKFTIFIRKGKQAFYSRMGDCHFTEYTATSRVVAVYEQRRQRAENNVKTASVYQTSEEGQFSKEALFKVVHIVTKHKKPFTDGRIVQEAMTVVSETLFKDNKSSEK